MIIGIDIGGSHIGIGVVNDNGKIIQKTETRIMKKDKENITKFIEEFIIKNISFLQQNYEISKIGISIPGTLSETTVIKASNLNLQNYNIVESLNKKINIPIKIKNDAKCAAIAERKYGNLKGYERALFLTLGTGIGGAAITSNVIDMKCGFGHLVIEENGLQCNCGKKGCLERYASMKAFKDNFRKKLDLDGTTSGKEILEIIKNNKLGNKFYNEIEETIDNFIQCLGLGIANYIYVFKPEAIIIGGSFIYFEEVFLNRLKKYLLENKSMYDEDKVELKTALLGNDAGIIGASLI